MNHNDCLPIQDTGQVSAVFAGDGTMLVPCAEHFLARGHRIAAIVTNQSAIKRWAASAQIIALGFDELDGPWQPQSGFDYLFSIANLRVLPESVIRAPRRQAINFHDGPLPRYAGLNATTWAILNGETRHGISWHLMEAQIDAGDIVMDREVPIPPGTSSASLNLACYEAGIAAFADLLTDIAGPGLKRRTQNSTQRTYFGKYTRPGGGIIDWRRTAAEIAAYVRACDFGPGSNNFGTVKLYAGDDCILVHQAEALETRAGHAPGTILDVTDDELRIATAGTDLSITRMSNIEGGRCEKGLFTSGDRLPGPDPALVQAIDACWKTACRHEEGVVEALRLPAATCPYLDAASGDPGWRQASIHAALALDSMEARASAVLAFLCRLLPKLDFRVAVKLSEVSQAARGAEPCFDSLAPMVVPQLHAGQTLADYRLQVKKHLDAVRERGPIARDIRSRYPELPEGDERDAIVLDCTEDVDDAEAAQFTIAIAPEGGGIRLRMDAARITAQDFARLCAQLETFVAELVVDSASPLTRLPLLSAAERHALSVESTRANRPYPRDKTVLDLFRDSAASAAQKIAVRDASESLSYIQLDAQSSHLARRLNARGIGRGDRVGVFLDRSCCVVTALLGVLKSGAAYVPLDPIYPKHRLWAMAEDANLAAVVSTAALLPAFDHEGTPAVLLDMDEEVPDGALSDPSSNDRAYVIYTSGSTGSPKGVQIPHRALTNFLCAMAETPGIDPHDHLLALTTICFDIAALEIFLPLANGASVELVPADICRDGARLRTYFEQSGASVAQATPSTWQMLTDAGWQGTGALRILCGGEPLSRALAEALLPRCGELWNMFGPTETTIWSSCFRVTDAEEILIGAPIWNTQFHVLDPYLNPVPAGLPGELYIGGDGLASGYLNRPALTAERFVRNPYANEADALMYRTGDLVCRRGDGGFHYKGRMDGQIKFLGHRVELDDIRVHLAREPDIAQACVRLDREGDELPRILAYVVPSKGSGSLDVDRLRERLRPKLPAYMIPSVIVALPRMPLLPNGKLDSNALPTPPRGAMPEEPSPDQTGNIQGIVSLHWSRALGLDRPDPDQSFFDAGGNSLALTRMVAALGQALDRRLTSTDLFQHPTIRTFAAYLRDDACVDQQALPKVEHGPSAGRSRGAEYRRRRLLQKSRNNSR